MALEIVRERIGGIWRTVAKPSGGNGGSQPFTPTDLDDLTLWLDASDAATINAGSPTDGDPVSVWADKSGNGNGPAQATSDNQPTYKAAIQNGLAVVTFDGSAHTQRLDFTGAALALLDGKSGVTMFAVGRQDSGPGGNGPVLDSSGPGGVGTIIRLDVGQYTLIGTASNDATDQQGITLSPFTGDYSPWVGAIAFGISLSVESGMFAFDGPPLDHQFDNVSGGLSTLGPFPADIISAMVLGAATGAIIPGPDANTRTGDICEVIVYSRALNAVERRQVMDYLAAKWATL